MEASDLPLRSPLHRDLSSNPEQQKLKMESIDADLIAGDRVHSYLLRCRGTARQA